MARYLLDTDALIDFSKGFEPTTSRVLSWIDGGDELMSCAVTVAEFCSGLTAGELESWRQFLQALIYVDISEDAAIRAGQDRHAFSRQGRHLTVADSLLGAVSRESGAVIVTGNAKDFPMADVQVLPIR